MWFALEIPGELDYVAQPQETLDQGREHQDGDREGERDPEPLLEILHHVCVVVVMPAVLVEVSSVLRAVFGFVLSFVAYRVMRRRVLMHSGVPIVVLVMGVVRWFA